MEVSCEQAWKLLILLPRMLLFKTKRGGSAGERDLRRRVAMFDGGQWAQLLDESRRSVSAMMRTSSTEQKRLSKLWNLSRRVS